MRWDSYFAFHKKYWSEMINIGMQIKEIVWSYDQINPTWLNSNNWALIRFNDFLQVYRNAKKPSEYMVWISTLKRLYHDLNVFLSWEWEYTRFAEWWSEPVNKIVSQDTSDRVTKTLWSK